MFFPLPSVSYKEDCFYLLYLKSFLLEISKLKLLVQASFSLVYGGTVARFIFFTS